MQQAKLQDAQEIAAAVSQYQADEAKSAAARRRAALKTKDLMATQVCIASMHLQLFTRLLKSFCNASIPLLCESACQRQQVNPKQLHKSCCG